MTSYGRGYDFIQHSNMRAALGFVSLLVFATTLQAWGKYGDSGVGIEHMMSEVGNIVIFVGEQLGAASGSLATALKEAKKLPANPEDLYGVEEECPNPYTYPFSDTMEEAVFCRMQLDVFKKLAHAFVGDDAVFSVDEETVALLAKLDQESKNSQDYGSLGQQIVASIMRVRMILVYLVMQIGLIAAAVSYTLFINMFYLIFLFNLNGDFEKDIVRS